MHRIRYVCSGAFYIDDLGELGYTMSHQVVKVRREAVAPCMTCPLCHKLFRDATTIVECLHTFCQKCIYKKLSDEEMDCCPICNIDLGCVPLEKLRPDHNLQDVRAKIFPYKRIKVKSPEISTPVALPAKRKERSLSSLVVSTPRVSAQSGMTGRRSKSTARKASRGSSFTIEKPVKKDDDSTEDHPESSSSLETLNKFTQNMRQNTAAVEPSSNNISDKGRENGPSPWEGKADIWKPLTCLVEAANRSKSSKYGSQGLVAKSSALQSHDSDGLLNKAKNKEHMQRSKGQDENDYVPPEPEMPKKLRRIRQKKVPNLGECRIPPQALIDTISSTFERKNHPIWFSLVATDDQEGDATPLPQISTSYLRIKDGNIPVSFIQKYLTRKLELAREDEVEIKCMGQAIIPTLTLNNLVELWLQATSTHRVSAIIGSSAKDFVMVLGYARKVPDP